MTDIANRPADLPAVSIRRFRPPQDQCGICRHPPVRVALVAALFSTFLLLVGKSPLTFIELVWTGGFGTAFSWKNTLQRASPLILTALAVAIPARLGLTMIGGEGALVLSGFAAAAIAIPFVGSGSRPSSSCR